MISAAEVRVRAERVFARYEEIELDGSVPGALGCPARYMLVTCSQRGFGCAASYCPSHDAVERAAANVSEGWEPTCYYDLHELAGDEPPADEGDLVEYEGVRYHVIRVEDDHADGMMFRWYHLATDPGVDYFDGADVRADESRCVLAERVTSEDDRLPVRYDVASVRTIVVFNSIVAS